MPRNTNHTMLDPEDIYSLDTKQEVEEFIEAYQIGGFDSYNESRYDDFDMDNYGYGNQDY